MTTPKIAIVGASIAGSAAAIVLDRLGQDITVFEQRPKGILDDRGAGIALPKKLVQYLIHEDILDKDFPILNTDDRIFFRYNPKTDHEEYITKEPFIASSVHWGALYTNLAKRLPDDKTHYHTKVTKVTKDKKILLTLDNKDEQEFDIVFFADGYGSLGRNYLFPENTPQYTHYIAWRGILNRVDEETNKHLVGNVPFYLYEKGHLLIYCIPRLHTHNPNQEYHVNWLIYEMIEPGHPIYNDKRSGENIAPDAMPKEYVDYLHTLAKDHFAPFARDIILQTEKPFIQSIYDSYVPTYFQDNMGLIGDSSILLRPHVGAGSTKALLDAISLKGYLNKQENPTEALKEWGQRRQEFGDNLLVLCRDLGDLLVEHTPDWSKMNKSKMDAIWTHIMKGHEDWYQIKA